MSIMSTSLFPYFIARTTGIGYAELNELGNMGLISLMSEIRLNNEKKSIAISETTSFIHDFIQQLEDADAQKKLLNIKRDIFNSRKLATKSESFIANLPYPDFVAELNALLHKIETLEEALLKLKLQFDDIIAANKIKFKNKINSSEVLKNGLLLSSLEIIKALDHYVNPNIQLSQKREQALELSLIKYFSRACTKPSPFSTFTNISLGRAFSSGALFAADNVDGGLVHSIVRYNNFVFRIFLQLLFDYYPFYSKLKVKLNPSVVERDGKYSFFINFFNQEAFQEVDKDPLLEWVIDKYLKTPVNYTVLKNEIIEVASEDEDSINKYLQNLIGIGIIEYCYPVSVIDPAWEQRMADFLMTDTDDSFLAMIANDFATMYDLKNTYETSTNYEKRRATFYQINDIIYHIYDKLYDVTERKSEEKMSVEELFFEAFSSPQKNAKDKDTQASAGKKSIDTPAEGKSNDVAIEEKDNETVKAAEPSKHFKWIKSYRFGVKREKCFFEDTKLNVDFSINVDTSKKLEKTLSIVNEITNHFSGSGSTLLTTFFLKEFDANAQVPFLECYERYRKSKGKLNDGDWYKALTENDQAEQKSSDESTPKPSDRPSLDVQLEEYILECFKQPNLDFQKINLSSERLAEMFKKDTAKGKGKQSFGAFIQPIFDHNKDTEAKAVKFVINHWLIYGYGRFFGRFLHLFDPKVTEELVNFNNLESEGAINCESSDAALFNANLHPPLMQKQLAIPGAYTFYPAEDLIDINKLTLSYDKEHGRIVLKKDNAVVNVFDMGFQTLAGRSSLYTFLYNFTKKMPGPGVLCTLFDTLYYKNGLNKKIVGDEVFFPRISIDDFLVIQRMHWRFYSQDLPVLNDQQSFFEKFKVLEDWRVKYGLPSKFFVRHTLDKDDDNPEKKVSEDRKPAFIDFDNFLLVNVFIKMLTGVGIYIIIEEALPGNDEYFKINEAAHATELLVQLYE